MDVRVRLVFADEVGRHVLRRRGFSSCWYLVPTDAKLVGDLAHALLREFELRQRCPKGLELRLEELPLLATQSIRLVRDDDTIVVQCPPLEDVVSDKEQSSSSSESETKVKSTQRKRKPKQAQQLKKRIKRVQHALKEDKEILSVETKPWGISAAAAKKSSRVESSSSSSSSSSESECESSSESSSSSDSESSSESEDEITEQKHRKRATTAVPARTARTKEAASANSSASNGAASNTNAPAQTAKEPRRRRRRLRQRNGRRQRNCDHANPVESPTLPSDGNAATSEVHGRTTEKSKETSGARVGSNSVGPRGYPLAKAHVLFDEVTGDQVVVQRDDNLPNENTWTARRSQIPELAKYGPSSSGNHQSSRDSRVRTPASSDGQLNDNDASSGKTGAPKRKGKGKYEEMWKRPYEIVATVLDDNTENSSSSTEDLTKSLASYPTATASSCGFKPTDILAYKTLTLCLETWQPVLSEWQCGQVESVDASGNSIELSRWTIEVNGDSLSFNEAPGSEPCSVQTSEISELRFLSGPSYSSRQ
ncbi:hypothetical protein PF005_g713 [Phytophthora fragariae]|uniref:Coilin N-terminal domain-containing protein n=1 Tax=Phytophthora fragariae TaxID=53985 RepID=A0A6A3ZID0_9STRA|nr:hypothetical protein PF003_g8374 [Phytophthora fragariae]KAE8950117.1 hypothetical protein PF009_g337 [Phytophthora fragariae]KAE9031571.1 hypothetical protein PF011_g23 [Phytophthora fragariae]KAE9140223.1 hypothetical protein PF010_g271 [Phytophthora fragariae]KAE9141332.1 hypothetical protein PF007_g278 [Phytophthora fragariae]